MSCRCRPTQPDSLADGALTIADMAACPTCVLTLTADQLRIELAYRNRLIDRLHETRSTLMAERDNARAVADELRRELERPGYSILLPWETDLRQAGSTPEEMP